MSIFKIKKIESGWLEGYLESDKLHKDFCYSDLTDFLGDLLNEIILVLNGEKEIGLVETELEPGTECWRISYVNENIIIDINCNDKILNFIFDRNDFLNKFIKEIETNLDKYNNNFLVDSVNYIRTIDDLKD